MAFMMDNIYYLDTLRNNGTLKNLKYDLGHKCSHFGNKKSPTADLDG